jgi:hypothetical protein
MKLAFSGIAAAAVILSVLPVTQAAERDRGIDGRQARQEQRVDNGVRSGEVTRPEARNLNREARTIERKEQSYRADGRFSRSERRDVQRDLNRHGRHVYNARHNKQSRGDNRRRVHDWNRGDNRGRSHNWNRGDNRSRAHSSNSGNGRHYGRYANRGYRGAINHRSNRGNGRNYGRYANRGHRGAINHRKAHRRY